MTLPHEPTPSLLWVQVPMHPFPPRSSCHTHTNHQTTVAFQNLNLDLYDGNGVHIGQVRWRGLEGTVGSYDDLMAVRGFSFPYITLSPLPCIEGG